MPMLVPATAVLCAVLALPIHAEVPAFEATQRSYSTGLVGIGHGYYPQGHVLADLDGDGDLDVAVAHIGTGGFSILENAGDGSFEPARFVALQTPMTTECADLASGDLDGDGDIDLAFCMGSYGTTGQTIAVVANNGDATFALNTYYVCGRGPTGIVAFDADGDGDLDLATANWYWDESDVSVLLNDGLGSFTTRVDVAIPGSQPYKLCAGDFDGDGDADLAVSDTSNTGAVAVLSNTGAGTFGSPTWLPLPSGSSVNSIPGVHAADIDNDGDDDVLYSRGAQVGLWSSIGLYRSNGDGTFAALESFGVQSSGHDFAVADLTLDGWPDIVSVGHSDKYGYSLLPSNGAGGFNASQTFRSGEMARSISVGDVDNDGDRDVVVANSGSNTVTVHANASGAFSMPYSVATGAFCNGIATGDIDGDGDRDVVTTDSRIWSLFNDGSGAFSASIQNANFGALNAPKLHDVNGDGYVDLLVKTSGVLLALNEGAVFPGFFQAFVSLPTGNVSDFEVFDADNDGDLDVIGSVTAGTTRLALCKNDGAGNFAAATTTNASSVQGGNTLIAGDLDNDGDQDVVYGNGNAIAWLNNGSGSFGAPISTAAAGGFIRIVKGDFNGDGLLDVAGVNYDYNGAGENLVVLRGNGNGTFGAPGTYFGMFSLQYGGTTTLATLDSDQDGDLDIVCGAYGADDVTLFENNGNGTFQAPIGYGVSGSVTRVFVSDIDADGFDDVLANVGTEPPIGGAVQVLFGLSGTQIPVAYCTPGTSVNGCVAAIASSGIPSATLATPFALSISGIDGQRAGLVFYGVAGRAAVPWGPSSSTLCVNPPTQRTLAQGSGGILGACNGTLALDWNAFVAASPGALGAPFPSGAVIDAQGWWRDPASSKSTALSNALEFTLQP